MPIWVAILIGSAIVLLPTLWILSRLRYDLDCLEARVARLEKRMKA